MDRGLDSSGTEEKLAQPPDAANSFDSLDMDLDRPLPKAEHQIATKLKLKRTVWMRFLGIGLGVACLIAVVVVASLHSLNKEPATINASAVNATQEFNVQSVPLSSLSNQLSSSTSTNQQDHSLDVNGSLDVNNSLVIKPATTPSNAVAGQIYYNQKTNQLEYYNGSKFVSLQAASQTAAQTVGTSIGGTTGAIALGGGLAEAGGTLSNAGVLSLQGQTGNVLLNGGSGIGLTGTTITNTGVLALGGQTGKITLGTGLKIAGGKLSNSGITAITAGTNVTVSNNGGNVTINSTGGGTTGVSSFDGLTNALTLANSTGAGSTITLNNASTAQKGIAQFNGTNFSAVGGVVDTTQDIDAGSSPTFNDLTLTGNTINGQTISTAANFTGSLAVAGAITANTISPTGAMTIGATGQSLVLQGDDTTSLSATAGGNTTTLDFAAPTANVTYNLPAAAAGSYDICTTAGNCPGGGGGISGAGTANTITMFTGSGTIGNSIITQASTTITVGGTLSATNLQGNGSAVTNVNAATLQGNASSFFTNASNITSGTLADGQLSANVPLLNATTNNFTGTNLQHNGNAVCDTSNNCNYLTGTTANGLYIQLQGTTPGTAQTGSFNISGTGIVGTLKGTSILQNNNQVCDVSGNCAGLGGSVGTSGGTTGTLAVFTGADTIGNSLLSQSGTAVTIAGNSLTLNAASAATIQTAAGATSQALTLESGNASGGTAGTITLDTGTSSSGSSTLNLGTSNATNINLGNANAATTTTIQGGTGSTAINLTTGSGGTINLNGNVVIPATAGDNLTVNENATIGTIAGTTLTVGSSNVPSAKLNVNTGSTVAFRAFQASTFDVGQFAETGTGVGTVTTNATVNVVGSSTQLTKYFQVGDAIQIGTQLRTVSSITDDTHLAVSSAFTSSAGGQTYYRGVVGAGTVTTNGTTAIVGSGTSFTTTFQVGDSIMINGESSIGVISSITDNTHLTLFAVAATSASGLTYARFGYDRLDIKANGNVGIGTNAPSAALTIQPTGIGQTGLLLQAADGQTAGLVNVQDNSSNSLLGVTANGSGNDTVNVGYTGSGSVNSAVNVGTAIGGTQTVTVGSTTSASTTKLQAGATSESLSNTGDTIKTTTNSTTAFQVQNAGGAAAVAVDTTTQTLNIAADIDTIANNNFEIGATNATGVDIGNTGLNNLTTIYGSGLVRATAGNDSTTIFQVQNASGFDVMAGDTFNGQVLLGQSSHINGTLAFQNSTNANVITLKTGAASSSYSLTLPTTAPSTSQCLQSGAVTASLLVFSSCGSGGSTTLQQAYNNSAGASPSIDVNSTNKGVTIQNDNTSPITGELFGVHDKTASGLGASLFSIANTGDTSITSSETTGTATSVTANSVSTGNGLSVSANGLTTGNGLNVSSTAAAQTAGALINANLTATLTTNAGTNSGSVLTASRSLTSNITGTVTSPVIDTSRFVGETAGVVTTWSQPYTVGTGGTNAFLLVGITEASCQEPVGVSYNSVGMTQIGSDINFDPISGGRECAWFYGLANPATGASHSITVTAVSDGTADKKFDMAASSWFNVNQTNPVGSFTYNTGTTSSASVAAQSLKGQTIVDMLVDGSGVAGSPTATQTSIGSLNDPTDNLVEIGASSAVATSTSTTMGWTGIATYAGSNYYWSDNAIGLVPAGAPAENVTGSVVSLSSNCSVTNGYCNDSSSLLSLNQQYIAATGSVLSLQNSGRGNGVNIQNSGPGIGLNIQNDSNYGTNSALQVEDSSGNVALAVDTTDVATLDVTSQATLLLGEDERSGNSIAAAGAVVDSLGDYAEYFPQATPGQLGPGDVACLDANGKVEPCNSTDTSETLAGVVSTSPGYIGNAKIYNNSDPSKTALISMLGQVPVKVSAANGAIHVGDMLTYSATDGVAVKATSPGLTIGQALESYSGSATGTINLYIHVGYFDPTASNGGYVQDGSAASFSALTVSGNTTLSKLTVTGDATFATLTVQDLTVGHIISNGSTPTIAADTTTCAGATATITGTDTAGIISLTAPSNCNANGKVAGVSFSRAFASAPNISLTPANSDAAGVKTYVDSTTTSTTNFNVSTLSSSLSGSTTYKWYYQVIQ